VNSVVQKALNALMFYDENKKAGRLGSPGFSVMKPLLIFT